MAYESFCQFIRGAGHIKKGIPCEDYGMKLENENFKIFTLGDGHGDENCPRSSFGAEAICKITVEELQQFAKEIKEQNWETKLFNPKTAEELVRQLIRSIFGKWYCLVNQDFEQHPLTAEEQTLAKNYLKYYQKGERIEHIYGTTLVAGLASNNYLLLLQQGDGRCVVFDSEGNATQPIPWDDRCFANITTSVCDTDAIASCRYHIIDLSKDKIIACVAGSDGVEDSFSSMEKMHAYYREKLIIASKLGITEFEKDLSLTLPILSEEGSHDDITICGIIDRASFNERVAKITLDNEILGLKDSLSFIQERLESMTPKLEFLLKKVNNTTDEYQILVDKLIKNIAEEKRIKENLDTIQTNFLFKQENGRIPIFNPFLNFMMFPLYSIKCLQDQLEKVKAESNKLENEIKTCFEQKRLSETEYSDYKEKYDNFLKLNQEQSEKIKNLENLRLD